MGKLILILVSLLVLMADVSVYADASSAQNEGRQLYLSYGCATCHGKDGDGNGIVPQRSFPPPTNFHDQKTYRHGYGKFEIINSIKYGIKEDESVMPAFDHLTADELELIAVYLESLQSNLQDIVVADAWIRLMPPSRPNSAAYMTIENKTQKELILQSVSSDVITTIEMHMMEHSDGMMRMRQVTEIRIPAGGKIELKPGGFHLMLFGIQKPLAKGDRIPFVLHFQGGSSVAEIGRAHV